MASPTPPSGGSSGRATAQGHRLSTNGDANLHPHSLKRLSLNTSRPQSPAINSPRRPAEHRVPSSPGPAFPPQSPRRSPSVLSIHRSSSPALGRKSSTSSLRGDMPPSPRPALSRRSSFNPNMPSPMGAKSPLHTQHEVLTPPKPVLRACDIAEEHFKKELALHESVKGTEHPGTVIIVHDQCYGHRFSRPNTKSMLSLIMERPERLLASVLGISAAYVMLGDRHAEGTKSPFPDSEPSERIPFQIRKTSRSVDITSPVVTNVHGTKWMEELRSLCVDAGEKLASSGKELTRDPPTLPGQPAKEKFHEGDLYLCAESLNAFQGALGGVLDAVDAVFQTGTGPSRAFVCVRPPGHHCSADWPSGFCWLNNVHVGIEHAIMNHGLTHAAIIDFDLHHGDGSQAITWARNKKVQNMAKNTPKWKKTSIGYFSIHDINSYPCEDGDDAKVQAASLCIDNAHGQSIWNIHLQVWQTPQEFWTIYEEKYLILLEKVRQYLKHHTSRLRSAPNHPAPKAAIFLSAGFDASEWETSGMQRHSVNVPTEFYARFTRDVVRLAEELDTGVDGRVVSVLEGGYSDRALASGVMSHISGLCDGQVFSEPGPTNGLGFNMQQRLDQLSGQADQPTSPNVPELTPVTYNPAWWNAMKLSELENLITPPPPVIPKKVRTGPPPNFSSPTQSFSAKVVDPSKLQRSFSGRQSLSPSRAPTPPPPEVDWATATHALAKLLIPADRQTRSCKPEELSGPKVKKEKPAPAPALTSVHVDPSGRQLRGRKPVTTYADPDSDDDKKATHAESHADRRRTIADLPLAPPEPPAASQPASRRMSIASSVSSVNGGERSVSRASSAMPGRKSAAAASGSTSSSIPAKKARSSTAASSRVPKTQPPVPRVPTNHAAKPTSTKEKEVKEKENDIDQITSGLKRITLKLPPKEEYEARERQREAEKKAAAKTTTRKAPVARTSKSAPKATVTTTKKAPSRLSKSSKPSTPVEPEPPVPAPELPKTEKVNEAPLEQPQPVQLEQASALVEQALPAQSLAPEQNADTVSPPERRTSTGIVEPPTELAKMDITPDQLPKPSFVTATEPLPVTTSPPRPDTPPPPPPSSIPFVNYTTQTFGTNSSVALQEAQNSNLQWMPPNMDTAAPTSGSTLPVAKGTWPVSPAAKRQDLPVFTANGSIPFAPAPTAATGDVQAAPSKAEDKEVWDVPETRAPAPAPAR
ncbi:Arginase/deacetylase [Corynespora cassiicola Philippines]|uniref:Arginase/deacetylase n=1 Tax=Corynespora cassiicola Philippines TaxID=1448308 RepID=A0A2T2NVC0_CORCC|nr:Arginase/deacetylase [Corynespora cassiicola Philippines]